MKMKILMLHGWTQNAEVFRGKTKAFVRKVEKVPGTCLHWVTAPHDVPPGAAGDRPNARAWFYFSQDDKSARVDAFSPVKREYCGWEISRNMIAECWQSNGPFDVVIGFSQGAVATHQLLVDIETVLHHAEHFGGRAGALRAAGFIPEVDGGEDGLPEAYKFLLQHPPKAAMLVAGFPSRHAHHVDGLPLLTPSMHISADNDETVPPWLQQELAAAFKHATMLMTTQGHAMPQRAADMAAVCAFLSGFSQ